MASCLYLMFLPFETPYKNGTQKLNDKNRLSDIRLQKKSINIPKLVSEQQQEETITFYHWKLHASFFLVSTMYPCLDRDETMWMSSQYLSEMDGPFSHTHSLHVARQTMMNYGYIWHNAGGLAPNTIKLKCLRWREREK